MRSTEMAFAKIQDQFKIGFLCKGLEQWFPTTSPGTTVFPEKKSHLSSY